jgi:hypothetical protein
MKSFITLTHGVLEKNILSLMLWTNKLECFSVAKLYNLEYDLNGRLELALVAHLSGALPTHSLLLYRSYQQMLD